MTIRERIIAFLQEHPIGIDDDALTVVLNLKSRQQANSRCRQLAKEGLIDRQVVNGKIHNVWVADRSISPVRSPSSQATELLETNGSKPWFWEGNVQAVVVRYLVAQTYVIHSFADTATKARGKDIIAERNGVPLWLTVKGYPEGTRRTNPSTQAGHWFKQAIFDIIAYRSEDINAELGLVLPNFSRYRSLAHKVNWLQPIARFAYYWVQADGLITVE